MLCPEVWNFDPPKVKTMQLESDTLDKVLEPIKMNQFYKSLVLTLPDQISVPDFMEESLLDDTEYYQIQNIPLLELIDPVFTESFVKNGSLYCLSINRNCIIENCACITANGILTLHVIDYIFQTLGLEGTKRAHNFYEVCINLNHLKHPEKIAIALKKLELFDLNISWIPNNKDVCPSSIAKYFSDKKYAIKVCSLQTKRLTPPIEEIPSLQGADIEELVEWIGMLSIEGDLTPKESFINTYASPESDNPMKTSRITILIVKGFITPNIISNLSEQVSSFVLSREVEEYWASVSIQSWEDSLWQWSAAASRMFQAHDSSGTIFISQNKHVFYLVGQIKYS